MATPAPRPISILTRAFVAQFFDNDFTRGAGDLRSSFFWLIAFLAPLGVFMPWMMAFQYQGWAFKGGTEMLRTLSMADKTLYLGLAMVASGAIGIITWGSLLVDRRDALILGALPVTGRTIVGAKLAALVIYVGLVAVGMHAAASISFGFVLATGNSLAFMARGIWAHFVASCLASLFVLFAMTAAQAIVLSVVGARAFARVSPLLQAIATMLVISGALALPAISGAIVPAIDARSPQQAWVLLTPQAWFLGAYEALLGQPGPVLRGLARSAVLWTAAACAITAAIYPLAYRRVMSTAILGLASRHRHGIRTRLAWLLPSLVRRASTRAIVQFTLAVFDRSERHRFVLAMGAGIALALAWPGVLTLMRPVNESGVTPSVAVLAMPVMAIIVLLVVLRIAGALPVQPNAAWLFAAVGMTEGGGRAGLRYVMYLLGVLPPVLVSFAVVWLRWDVTLSVTHVVLCTCLAALLTEGLLWRYAGIPGARTWHPEGAGLRKWWPLYLGGVLLVTRGVPPLTLSLSGSPSAVAAVAVLSFILAVVLARLGRPRASAILDDVEGAEVATGLSLY